MKLKTMITCLCALLCVLGTTVSAFNDVAEGTELEKAVQYLQIQGGLRSDQELLYRRSNVTRVAFLKMMLAPLQVTEEDRDKYLDIKLKFTDVEPFTWYTPVLQKAVFLGVLENEEKPFYPGMSLHRVTALEWALKANGIPVPYTESRLHLRFKDIVPGSFFRHTVARTVKYNLLDPVKEDVFGISTPLMREEAVLLLYRIHDLQGEFAGIYREPDAPVGLTDEGENTIVINVGSEGYYGESASNMLDLGYIDMVWGEVQYYYMDSASVDPEELTRGALEGMVESLGDKYSVYLPPAESESFLTSLDGELEGIGSYIDGHPMGVIVDAVIPDTPAEKSGVRAGDVIYKVDGEDMKGLTPTDIAYKIRGPKGTTVKLSILRNDVPIEIEVVRDSFIITSIEKELRGNVYYVRIADFRDATGEEFDALVSEIKQLRPRALLIDIRGNRGGYLLPSIDILKHFFKEGTLLATVEYGKRDAFEYYTDKDGELLDMPLYVLMDENTASSSEVLAGTLQDYGRATLLGEPSYGKGTVQTLLEFTDNSSLKLTVAKWLTGKGRWISEWTDEDGKVYSSLQPDMNIENNIELFDTEEILRRSEEGEKLQLNEALRLIEHR